jgi:uncharacterized protein (TIGR03435 family)
MIMPFKRRQERVFTILIAVTVAFVIACKSFAAADTNGQKIGGKPPPLVFSKVVEGPSPTEISWDKLKGKVVVLEFWATWCGPCVASIPHWNGLVDQFQGKPVIFLAVSSENEDVVRSFLKLHPIRGWIGLDGYEDLKNAFDVQGIPHTVIVDAIGRIAAITHPAKLEPHHLEEVLNGQKCSLPEPVFNTRSLFSSSDVVSAEAPPLFEVSIRERKLPKIFRGPICSWSSETNGSGYHGKLATVESGLQCVFGFSECRMKIDGTLPEGYYDFELRAPAGHKEALQNQFIAALRTTFGLEIKRATRMMETYQVTQISNNAPGLYPTEEEGGGGSMAGGFRLHGSDMKTISAYIELALEKPVFDETKLGGRFIADMQWKVTDEESKYHPKPDLVIEAARTRMGLQLTSVRRPVEILEIRRIGGSPADR